MVADNVAGELFGLRLCPPSPFYLYTPCVLAVYRAARAAARLLPAYGFSSSTTHLGFTHLATRCLYLQPTTHIPATAGARLRRVSTAYHTTRPRYLPPLYCRAPPHTLLPGSSLPRLAPRVRLLLRGHLRTTAAAQNRAAHHPHLGTRAPRYLAVGFTTLRNSCRFAHILSLTCALYSYTTTPRHSDSYLAFFATTLPPPPRLTLPLPFGCGLFCFKTRLPRSVSKPLVAAFGMFLHAFTFD